MLLIRMGNRLEGRWKTMKTKDTVVVKVEGDAIVDVIQVTSNGEVARSPKNSVTKLFPTNDMIVLLENMDLHLVLRPGGYKNIGKR